MLLFSLMPPHLISRVPLHAGKSMSLRVRVPSHDKLSPGRQKSDTSVCASAVFTAWVWNRSPVFLRLGLSAVTSAASALLLCVCVCLCNFFFFFLTGWRELIKPMSVLGSDANQSADPTHLASADAKSQPPPTQKASGRKFSHIGREEALFLSLQHFCSLPAFIWRNWRNLMLTLSCCAHSVFSETHHWLIEAFQLDAAKAVTKNLTEKAQVEVFSLDSKEKVPILGRSVKTATVKAHLWSWTEGRDPGPYSGQFCWIVHNQRLIQLENKWPQMTTETRLPPLSPEDPPLPVGFLSAERNKIRNKDALLPVWLCSFVLCDSQTHMWKTLVYASSLQVCRTVVPGGVAQRLRPDSLAWVSGLVGKSGAWLRVCVCVCVWGECVWSHGTFIFCNASVTMMRRHRASRWKNPVLDGGATTEQVETLRCVESLSRLLNIKSGKFTYSQSVSWHQCWI